LGLVPLPGAPQRNSASPNLGPSAGVGKVGYSDRRGRDKKEKHERGFITTTEERGNRGGLPGHCGLGKSYLVLGELGH